MPAMRFLFILLLAAEPARAAGSGPHFTVKRYYQDLPPWDRMPVIAHPEPSLDEELRAALGAAPVSSEGCPLVGLSTASVNAPIAARSNICDPAASARLKAALSRMAPSLDPSRLVLWKAELDPEGPDLLLGGVHVNKEGDPYLFLWLLRPRPGRMTIKPTAWFLNGAVHAVRDFGPGAAPTVFVRNQGCTECEPWTYLHALRFSARKARAKGRGEALRLEPALFTYAPRHKPYSTRIEYALPGKGHSVDADVETRIPRAGGAAGAHLIQHYVLKKGAPEWWVFTCRELEDIVLRCDYELFKDRLPEAYREGWEKGERL